MEALAIGAEALLSQQKVGEAWDVVQRAQAIHNTDWLAKFRLSVVLAAAKLWEWHPQAQRLRALNARSTARPAACLVKLKFDRLSPKACRPYSRHPSSHHQARASKSKQIVASVLVKRTATSRPVTVGRFRVIRGQAYTDDPDPNHIGPLYEFPRCGSGAYYALWKSRGAEFITEPIPKYGETRCYIRDPDGYIIEVGQSTELTLG